MKLLPIERHHLCQLIVRHYRTRRNCSRASVALMGAVGHRLPGLAGVAVGLVLLAPGPGALKPNASSLLCSLYGKGDARWDGGFTLLYLGINLGAFIGPLITGLLHARAGFHRASPSATRARMAGTVTHCHAVPLAGQWELPCWPSR